MAVKLNQEIKSELLFTACYLQKEVTIGVNNFYGFIPKQHEDSSIFTPSNEINFYLLIHDLFSHNFDGDNWLQNLPKTEENNWLFPFEKKDFGNNWQEVCALGFELYNDLILRCGFHCSSSMSNENFIKYVIERISSLIEIYLEYDEFPVGLSIFDNCDFCKEKGIESETLDLIDKICVQLDEMYRYFSYDILHIYEKHKKNLPYVKQALCWGYAAAKYLYKDWLFLNSDKKSCFEIPINYKQRNANKLTLDISSFVFNFNSFELEHWHIKKNNMIFYQPILYGINKKGKKIKLKTSML